MVVMRSSRSFIIILSLPKSVKHMLQCAGGDAGAACFPVVSTCGNYKQVCWEIGAYLGPALDLCYTLLDVYIQSV